VETKLSASMRWQEYYHNLGDSAGVNAAEKMLLRKLNEIALKKLKYISFSFKCLFIEVLQGYSAPYSATSIYIYSDYNNRFDHLSFRCKYFRFLKTRIYIFLSYLLIKGLQKRCP
jgi:hypothetical protein